MWKRSSSSLRWERIRDLIGSAVTIGFWEAVDGLDGGVEVEFGGSAEWAVGSGQWAVGSGKWAVGRVRDVGDYWTVRGWAISGSAIDSDELAAEGIHRLELGMDSAGKGGEIGIGSADDDAGMIRLVAVQASGCAPIVQAWQQGASESSFWPDSQTLAFGINVPNRQATDHKTLSAVVDIVLGAQRNKLHRLAAELAFQDSERKAGIDTPGTVPIVPRASSRRYGLRPSHPLCP